MNYHKQSTPKIVRKSFSHYFLVMLFLSVFSLLLTQNRVAHAQDNQSAGNSTEPEVVLIKLPEAAKAIDTLILDLTQAQTNNDLNKLMDGNQSIIKAIDLFITTKRAEIDALQASLIAIGETQQTVDENGQLLPENKAIKTKRVELTKQQESLEKSIADAETLKLKTQDLTRQIAQVRQIKFKTQLTSNSGSMLSAQYWQNIFTPTETFKNRLNNFINKFQQAWHTAFSSSALTTTLFILLGSILWLTVRLKAENVLVLFANHYIPLGKFRRSFLATMTPISTILATGISLHFIFKPLMDNPELPMLVGQFIFAFSQLAMFCALITSLGRVFLANSRPSWRMIKIDNNSAHRLRYFPTTIAAIALVFGSMEIINSITGVIVSFTVWTSGMSSFLIALSVLYFPVRIYYTQSHEDELDNSSREGLIHVLLLLSALFVIVCGLIGYVSLASFTIYQTLWISLVFIAFYVLTRFSEDFFTVFFSNKHRSGRVIKQTFNLNDRLLEQARVLFSALAKCFLIFMLLMALFNGSFGGNTTQSVFDKLLSFLTGNGVTDLNLVPTNLLNATLIIFAGIYVLNASRNWLSKEFLPKTNLDIGIRASLVTLYSNLGYVLIILFTLSALGIEWSKLAWIVSALSVGIGFGLQEIVKNFISGLILLTERPVKVGDSIGIAGIEGDIKRINVRATEIQLSDKSTVIVPNSQLIAQNVKNSSKGNPQGVVSIALNFAITVDPEQVRDILLACFNEHGDILETPKPIVRFSQLETSTLTLTVTGYVTSHRLIGSTKSDLLFILLKALRTAGIYPSE